MFRPGTYTSEHPHPNVRRVDPCRDSVYLVDMIKCRGCGREIDSTGMYLGNKYLCMRCLHTQTAGQESLHAGGKIAFVAVVASALVVIALAGLAICILYLSGNGPTAWFALPLALMLCSVLCPAFLFPKRRNLTLLIAAPYISFSLC